MQFWQNQYRNFTIKGILWEIRDDGAEVLLHTEMKCSIGAEVFTIVKKCRNKLKKVSMRGGGVADSPQQSFRCLDVLLKTFEPTLLIFQRIALSLVKTFQER